MIKLIRFLYQGKVRLGLQAEDKVIGLSEIGQFSPNISLVKLATDFYDELRRIAATDDAEKLSYKPSDLQLLPPVDANGKIIGAAVNYHSACAIGGSKLPKSPVLFAKYSHTLIGQGQAVTLPMKSQQITYEGELAIVIGREATMVDPARAHQYIAGITAANDISASDLIREDSNFFRGKNFNGFLPLGPSFIPVQEVPNLNDLPISTEIDGIERQRSSTGDMIFSCASLISYISQIFTLHPGDVILTGTPAGVAAHHTPAAWLQDGQTVSVRIGSFLQLTNPVMRTEP